MKRQHPNHTPSPKPTHPSKIDRVKSTDTHPSKIDRVKSTDTHPKPTTSPQSGTVTDRDIHTRHDSRVTPHTCPNSPQNTRRLRVQDPAPLLEFLKQKLPGKSLTSIKDLLKHACIRIDNAPVTQFDYPLAPGTEVELLSPQQARFALSDPRLTILFEDAHLLVVHKASGLHSVDTTGHGVDNAASILEAYIRKRDPARRIFIVHRLDRDTSGVMIFAKTREAQDKLVKSWNDSVLRREYIALAEGTFAHAEGTIDSYLYEDDRKVVHATSDPHKGLRAITHYWVLSASPTHSLVKLELDTGRTNQIRVHLQSLGHPIAGDAKYGATTDPINRLALHAQNITFKHPMTHKVLTFQVDAPFALP